MDPSISGLGFESFRSGVYMLVVIRIACCLCLMRKFFCGCFLKQIRFFFNYFVYEIKQIRYFTNMHAASLLSFLMLKKAKCYVDIYCYVSLKLVISTLECTNSRKCHRLL